MPFLDSISSAVTGAYNSASNAVTGAYSSATDYVQDSLGIGGTDTLSRGPLTRGGARRKINSSLPGLGGVGGDVLTGANIPSIPPPVQSRARISPLGAGINLFGSGAIMAPLQRRNSLVFPYTPTIQLSSNADYEPTNIPHTVYKSQSYSKSYVSEITLTADFTAQTTSEARYMLAAMHFFRSVTKSYFGASNGDLAGSPPPVVRFDYLGNQMFNNVPVVVKTFSYTLPPDVDYVIINEDGLNTQVPSFVTLMIVMEVYYNPIKLRDTFSVAAFRDGSLLNQGYI